MKTSLRTVCRCVGLIIAAGLLTQTCQAQLLVSIDMDTSTAGIQSTRIAAPGETFDAAIVFDLTSQPGGLSSYGVSVQFDNTELSLNGSPAATAFLPGGFFHLSPTGVGTENGNIGGGLGQVSTFEAATLGLGPTSGSFTAGTISFTVLSPVVGADIDITPGLFNVGVDGLFDNSSVALAGVVFTSGSVVPEPSEYALATGGLLLAGGLFRRWRRSK